VGLALPVDEPVAAAVEAERRGLDFVACGEHVAFHGPTPNAFVWLAAAAGATTSVGLVSTVTLLAQYPPVLAAKLVASLDHVSGGRFSLGVGVGGEYPEEFRAVGVDPATRGPRTDEAVAVLRALLGGQRTSFEGRFTRFGDLAVRPPSPRGGVPLWVGGRSEAAQRRAGRYGDVWLPYLYTPEQLASGLEAVRRHAAGAGRPPTSVQGAVFLWTALDEDPEAARRTAVDHVGAVYRQDFSRRERYLLFGTPEEAGAKVGEYVEAGASSVVVSLCGALDDRAFDRLGRLVAAVGSGPDEANLR
jgi:probable F420-dependent oxidoreductase